MVCLLIVTASATPVENCSGSCAHEAAIGTTHYDTLAEAITAAKSGNTVTMLSDVTITTPVTVGKSLVLDLGSRTLTANLSAPEQSALRFSKDGIIRNGKVAVSEGSAVMVSDCEVSIEKDVALESTGTAPVLRLTAGKEKACRVNVSGKISGKDSAALIDAASEEGSCELYILKDAKLIAEENPAIAFNCAGKLSMEDGTIQAKKDAVCVTIAKDRKTELSVTGGKILTEEGESIVVTTEEDAEAPKDFVTGGTFKKLPRAYIPAYCVIRENADGTFTVISSYTLTFQANGGSGTMEPVIVRCGSAVTLPACSFKAPKDMDFAGWEINGVLFAPGDIYIPNANMAVTALWKPHQHTGGSATCLKKAVCEICGKSYGKLGDHVLTYTGGYPATCTTTGMNGHSKCSVCGGCFVDGIMISASALTIPAPGHDWEAVEGKPATCDEDGLHEHRKCNTCGTLQIDGKPAAEDDLVIPATGHTLEAVEATQATCEEAGIQAHEHCTSCDQRFLNGKPVTVAQLTIATASHVLSDWQSDEYYHWKSCVDCGEVFRQNGHMDSDLDGACDDCGYAMPLEKNDAPIEEAPFSWLFLIPIIAAVAIAIPLVIKKRK